MIRTFAAAITLAFVFGGAGAASAQTYLSDWGVADMRTAITGAGSTVIREEVAADGAPYIAARTAGGVKYSVTGRVCDFATGAVSGPKRCRGAHIQTRFAMDTPAAATAAVQKYTADFVAVSFSNDGAKDLLLSRYLIFDHGVHRENLKLNISVFTGIAERIWAEV